MPRLPAVTTELYPPVTAIEITYAENRLGFSLPPLLRELYLRVGNGGYGSWVRCLRSGGRLPLWAALGVF